MLNPSSKAMLTLMITIAMVFSALMVFPFISDPTSAAFGNFTVSPTVFAISNSTIVEFPTGASFASGSTLTFFANRVNYFPAGAVSIGTFTLPAGTTSLTGFVADFNTSALSVGTYYLAATDGSGYISGGSINVSSATPTITLNESSAAAGHTVKVTGSGFDVGSNLTFYLKYADGPVLLKSIPSSSLSKGVSLTVSENVPEGSYAVVAQETSSESQNYEITADASLEITPVVIVSPTSINGTVKSTFTLTGYGFEANDSFLASTALDPVPTISFAGVDAINPAFASDSFGSFGVAISGLTAQISSNDGGSQIISIMDASSKVYTNVGLITVNFYLDTYSVSFLEMGLPSGVKWYVNLTEGRSFNSTSSSISFLEPNGTYSYSISSESAEYQSPHSSGNVTVSGKPVSITINFSESYWVTFYESGLPSGIAWYVNVTNGSLHSSFSSVISFLEPNGTYSYIISSAAKNYSSPQHIGSFTVNGKPVSINASFSLTYSVTFSEKGLPPGTEWGIDVGDNTVYSSNENITTLELSGTYYYFVEPINEYVASPSSGVVTVPDYNITVRIDFSFVSMLGEVPIVISNNNLQDTGEFQKMLTVSWAQYSRLLSPNIGNVRFSYANGTLIPAWVENNATSTSEYSEVWLLLYNIPSRESIAIEMEFYPFNVTFDGVYWGEASQLSPVFGEYDNIYNVMFNGLYYNFYVNTNGQFDSTNYQDYLYAAKLGNGISLGYGNFVSDSDPFWTNLSGTTQNVNGVSDQNVIMNFQSGYQGGTSYPNPPIFYAGDSWVMKAVGFVQINNTVTFSVQTDDGSAIGTGTDGGGSNYSYSLGGSSNPNNVISEWHTTSSALYMGAAPGLGDYRFEWDYFQAGGSAYTALWSSSKVNYYFALYPPNGDAPSASFGTLHVFARVYTVTFHETGLPIHSDWGVSISNEFVNESQYSTNKSTSFLLGNGTYSFQLSSVSTYVPSPSKGAFKINGTNASISIKFSEALPVTSIPITISNFENVSTGSYQQLITIDSQQYSMYINLNWSNVEFEYQDRSGIPAWLESGNSNASSATQVWLSLSSIPAGGSLVIYMVIYPDDVNVLSPIGYMGESPYLSHPFGKYDNGARVFPVYANFQGSNFSSNWTLEGSALFVPHEGVETVNGVNNEMGAVVYKGSFSQENMILETSTSYQGRADQQNFGLFSGNPSTSTGGNGGVSSAGYTMGFDPYNSIAQIYYNGSSVDSFTFWGGGTSYFYNQIFENSTAVQWDYSQSTTNYTVGVYNGLSQIMTYRSSNQRQGGIFVSSTTGGSTSIQYVYWIRARFQTPFNVMPSFSIGSTSNPYKYNITFTESGLPSGNKWSVTLNGQTESSLNGSISFLNFSTGKYFWTVTNPLMGADGIRYYITDSSGYVDIPFQTEIFLTFGTQFEVNILTTGNGTVTPSGVVWVNAGSTFNISELPSANFAFNKWVSSANISVLKPYAQDSVATVDGPGTIYANFTETGGKGGLILSYASFKVGFDAWWIGAEVVLIIALIVEFGRFEENTLPKVITLLAIVVIFIIYIMIR